MVRAIPAPGTGADKSRKFFDDMNDWARSEGLCRTGLRHPQGRRMPGGPIAKNHGRGARWRSSIAELGLGPDDGLFFAAGKDPHAAAKLAGIARTRDRRSSSNLIDQDRLRALAWIVDFPFYEWDEETKHGRAFAHNPFSMPQGGLAALETGQDPLAINAYPIRSGLQRLRDRFGLDPQPVTRH